MSERRDGKRTQRDRESRCYCEAQCSAYAASATRNRFQQGSCREGDSRLIEEIKLTALIEHLGQDDLIEMVDHEGSVTREWYTEIFKTLQKNDLVVLIEGVQTARSPLLPRWRDI
ncbi:hypothetical protein AJ80_00240 [Polytolypa hystricis UAMH7299]|uniref:Uncharacterized protein n=1 Tax=Polytolypa hystricis (strain UAMH7299) TaxID=1447883 RepID=A0A2B7Z302_POLH7|nr:hypothetical protein AJ80_00240 [Polytolypa hystricis UAMH7299]